MVLREPLLTPIKSLNTHFIFSVSKRRMKCMPLRVILPPPSLTHAVIILFCGCNHALLPLESSMSHIHVSHCNCICISYGVNIFSHSHLISMCLSYCGHVLTLRMPCLKKNVLIFFVPIDFFMPLTRLKYLLCSKFNLKLILGIPPVLFFLTLTFSK